MKIVLILIFMTNLWAKKGTQSKLNDPLDMSVPYNRMVYKSFVNQISLQDKLNFKDEGTVQDDIADFMKFRQNQVANSKRDRQNKIKQHERLLEEKKNKKIMKKINKSKKESEKMVDYVSRLDEELQSITKMKSVLQSNIDNFENNFRLISTEIRGFANKNKNQKQLKGHLSSIDTQNKNSFKNIQNKEETLTNQHDSVASKERSLIEMSQNYEVSFNQLKNEEIDYENRYQSLQKSIDQTRSQIVKEIEQKKNLLKEKDDLQKKISTMKKKKVRIEQKGKLMEKKERKLNTDLNLKENGRFKLIQQYEEIIQEMKSLDSMKDEMLRLKKDYEEKLHKFEIEKNEISHKEKIL